MRWGRFSRGGEAGLDGEGAAPRQIENLKWAVRQTARSLSADSTARGGGFERVRVTGGWRRSRRTERAVRDALEPYLFGVFTHRS